MEEKIKSLTRKLEDTKTQIAFKCKELGQFNAKKDMQQKRIAELKEELDDMDNK